MDISKRIERLGDNFVLFNVTEGLAYVLIKMQDKWIIPDLKEYNVTYSLDKEKGYYFYTELENGTDCLFDAIEATINYNKALIEKMKLFKAKAEELKNLFAEESLDRLKNLKFIIDEPTQAKEDNDIPDFIKKEKAKPTKGKKKKKETSIEENTVEDSVQENETFTESEQEEKREQPIEGIEESNIMGLVKNMVDE